MSFLWAFIHRQFIYTPPVPTASFKDKVAIVTGSNVGLGKEACRWLVQLGISRVIIACRNVDKGKATAKDIQSTTSCSPDTLDVWELDMSSYKSVIAFAERAKTELPRLDILISNAGLMTREFQTVGGTEEVINTNVISLFLHAFLLLPKLHETAVKHNTESYFTITSSELYEVAKFKESKVPDGQIFATLNDKKKSNFGDRYNVSKLIEIFIVKQLAEMAPVNSGKVIVNCVAPGFCATDLAREYKGFIVDFIIKRVARKAEVGGRTLVYGASAGPESHGQYVPDCKITPTGGLTRGQEGVKLQRRVWTELKAILEGIKPGITSLSF